MKRKGTRKGGPGDETASQKTAIGVDVLHIWHWRDPREKRNTVKKKIKITKIEKKKKKE